MSSEPAIGADTARPAKTALWERLVLLVWVLMAGRVVLVEAFGRAGTPRWFIFGLAVSAAVIAGMEMMVWRFETLAGGAVPVVRHVVAVSVVLATCVALLLVA